MRRTKDSRSATRLAQGRASAVLPVAEPHLSPLIRSAQDATLCLYWPPVESHRTARIYTRSRNKETVTSLILEINKWERRIAKSGPPPVPRHAARQVLFYFVLKAIYRWDCLLWVCRAWGRPALAQPLAARACLARRRRATSRPPTRRAEHNLKLTDTAQPPNGQQLSHSPSLNDFTFSLDIIKYPLFLTITT